MQLIDWLILAGMFAVLSTAALFTRRYSKSVAGFLAAGRCARRYLISVAFTMSQLGVITLVWFFEQNFRVGYTSAWWPLMEGPAWIIMALSGWVIYRYRQTRAMTLAQFLEMRYSRNFRVFAGLVAYMAGMINFGIFPSISARFFIALCSLPDRFAIGPIELSTFVCLVILLTSFSLFFTFVGGQIAVMVTDFLQGILANIIFAIISVFLLLTFGWDRISQALQMAPPEQSLVHPFHLGGESQFNISYYAIGVVIMFYTMMAWQGNAGYYSAALSPHEAKMAGILSGWRFRVLMLMVIILPVCVWTFLHHPDFASRAAPVQARIAQLTTDTLRDQMRTPLALAAILPAGLLGLACAAGLAAHIATHNSYLHSWGSILIQDVILPFRRAPLTTRQHLWFLRLSICGVAAFICTFSILFKHTQYIAMFCALSASVFVGGAGSVIIGGLYWKRGTTEAAWAAMITGMTLSLAGIVIKQYWPQFFLTGQELSFWTIVVAVTVYICVSLVVPRREFNLDRMLHRGKYAEDMPDQASQQRVLMWWERLGFSKEFSGTDRVITYISVGWPIVWSVIFVGVTAYNAFFDVPATSWLRFWHGWTWFILTCSIVVTAWFAVGGFRDLRALFALLRSQRTNPADDGRVEQKSDAAAFEVVIIDS